jgi:hypothetical protein
MTSENRVDNVAVIKINVKFLLCLTKYHAMKTYRTFEE